MLHETTTGAIGAVLAALATGALLTASACEPDGETSPQVVIEDTAVAAEVPEQIVTSPPRNWVDQGTMAVPAYGSTCRLSAGELVVIESDGSADDSLSLTIESDGGAVVSMVVNEGGKQVLQANLTLDRGLPEKSWRDGHGNATFGGASGSVAFSSLCLSDRATPGQAVSAEFSIIVGDQADGFTTVHGQFELPASAVTEGPVVDDDTLLIELQ